MIIKSCNKCDLCISNKMIPVKPTGNSQGRLFIINDLPDYSDRKSGFTLTNNAGKLFRYYLKRYSLENNAYITNLVKCKPPYNRDAFPHEINSCNEHLQNEIDYYKPNMIVLLGKNVISSIFPDTISSYMGELNNTVRDKDGILYYFMYHPAYILTNPDKNTYDVNFKAIQLLYTKLNPFNLLI